MSKQERATTTNATLLRLKNTPFDNAKQLKEAENRIRAEEWEIMERARQRSVLLKKTEYRVIIRPLTQGLQAKFAGPNPEGNAVRVYLTDEDRIQVEVDSRMKQKDELGAVESFIRSLTDSCLSGYYKALGFGDDNLLKSESKKHAKRT